MKALVTLFVTGLSALTLWACGLGEAITGTHATIEHHNATLATYAQMVVDHD